MESKIMQIFYGADCLPYKDQERVVHYPIVGQAFQGASQTTEIHFYIDRIGGNNATWVATAKLPNGKIGSKVLDLEEDTELNENYVVLPLSSFYTQAQGNLFISLQGYDGGVEVEYDDETEIYSVVGTPVIQATGSVKIAINYSVQPIGSDEFEELTIQDLLAVISGKLNKNSNKYIKVVDSIANINTSAYADYLVTGDIVYDKSGSFFYKLYGTYPEFEPDEFDFEFSSILVNGTIQVRGDFNKIVDGNEDGLQNYIQTEISTSAATKVDKTNVGDRVYATDELGAQTTIPVDNQSISGGNIVRRVDSGGQIIVGNPQANNHATPKSYVDTEVQGAKTYAKDYADTLFTSALVYKGTKTVAELNALTGQKVGDFYNVSDSGILTAGNIEVIAGDNVAWTGSSWDKLTMDLSAYDDKFIAAGFFEVQDYNQNTGEITMVYASDLYDMSYTESTGILTIEAN